MNTHDIKDCFSSYLQRFPSVFLEGGTARLKALLSLGCFEWLDRGEIGGLESFQWLLYSLNSFASSVTKVGAF